MRGMVVNCRPGCDESVSCSPLLDAHCGTSFSAEVVAPPSAATAATAQRRAKRSEVNLPGQEMVGVAMAGSGVGGFSRSVRAARRGGEGRRVARIPVGLRAAGEADEVVVGRSTEKSRGGHGLRLSIPGGRHWTLAGGIAAVAACDVSVDGGEMGDADTARS